MLDGAGEECTGQLQVSVWASHSKERRKLSNVQNFPIHVHFLLFLNCLGASRQTGQMLPQGILLGDLAMCAFSTAHQRR